MTRLRSSVAFLALALPGLPAQAERPNIVLVLADDLGIGDLGCYNRDSKIPTPHLDRIAGQGMRFSDMHSPSAVCTPTRYALLTGRYAWRSRLKRGVLQGYSSALIEAGRMTLASFLKERGYATACVGKWHLGLGPGKRTDYSKPLTPGPNAFGFDWFWGIPASLDMPPYLWVENDRVVTAATEKIGKSEHRRRKGGGFWRAGDTAPGFRHADVLPVLGEKAVAWLEGRAKEPERPFFLYVPLSAPHTPWLPSENFRGRSDADYYGDFVAMVDDVVGKITAALERTGRAEETLLVVTSDNGSHWPRADIQKYGHRANLIYRGQKADIWEGGHRVPFLARWPKKIAPNSTSDYTACLTDVLATVAGVLGEDLPEDAGEDSFDLMPVLRGEGQSEPERIATVHHSLNGTFAIRHGNWKLILGRGSGGFTAPRNVPPARRKPGDPEGQLYDLERDPAETKNLWNERPNIVRRLQALLERYQEQGRSRPPRSRRGGTNVSGGPLLPGQAAFDVGHYRLRLRVDPEARAIEGELSMRAKALRELDEVVLHLDRRLEVRETAQWIEGAAGRRRVATRFTHEGGLVRLALATAVPRGETVRVSIAYGGRPRVAPNPPWRGGFTWKRTKDGRPWIATSCQGEGADLWWPCKDHPSDKAETMDLEITVPADLVCAANGVLESVAKNDDGTRSFHWSVKNPISNYCVALNIAPYEVVEDTYTSVTGEKVPVFFYCLPESLEKARRRLPEFLDHLRFFEEVCGPYPFRNEKYGVAETPHLGMEHQTIIAYGYRFRRNAFGYDWLHHHELSHEWWGNLVTCRDWKDMWIHEGFGTYMQALYVERKRGPKAYLNSLRRKGWGASRLPLAPRAITNSHEIYFGGGRDIYGKGAWVLHTLRWLIGDEKFFLAVRRMCYPTPAREKVTDGSQVRLVDTEDFRRLVEELTGRDLGWFFEVYLRQAGLPRLVSERKGGTLHLRWEVPGKRAFPMPVPVRVGARTQRVEMPDGKGEVRVPPVAEVAVDPDWWLLRARR